MSYALTEENEDIRIDNTFAIKEGDDSDKLFNDRRYYTGI